MDGSTTSTKKQPNIALAIFLVAQIIIIIFLAISISRTAHDERISETDLARQPQISLDGITTDDSTLPSESINHIQRVLFDVVSQNYPEIEVSDRATVRPESIKTLSFSRQNINYLSAVVDVPEAGAYQIFYSYTNLEENVAPNDFVAILCASDSSDCAIPNTEITHSGIAQRFLRYIEYADFTLGLSQDGTTVEIVPAAYEISDTDIASYTAKAKEAITSLGLSSDSFTYRVMLPQDFNYHI